MDDLVKANLVMVRRTDFWIEVEIKTDILFPSASAQLEPAAVRVIEKLGEALAPYPNPIRVEGHTDNRPIKTVAFISNWELSAARAGSVVRVLASKGVEPGRLAVIGYGENRPTHPNDTAEGRNANRRVVVVILSTDNSSSPSGENAPPREGSTPTMPEDAAAAPSPGGTPETMAPGTPATAPGQLTTSTTTAPPLAPATSPMPAGTPAVAPSAGTGTAGVGGLASPVTGTVGNVTSASSNAQ
jgi:chemotaxis protein MotB